MASAERQGFKQAFLSEFQWRRALPTYHTSEPFCRPLWRFPRVVFIVYRFAVCTYLNAWLIIVAYLASGAPSALMYFTAWGYILLCVSTLLLAVLTVFREVKERQAAKVAASESGAYVAVAIDEGNSTCAQVGESRYGTEYEEAQVGAKIGDECVPAERIAMADGGNVPSAEALPTSGSCCSQGERRDYQLSLLTQVTWVVYSVAVTAAPLISFAYFCIVVPLSEGRPEVLNAANMNLHAVNSLVVIIEGCLYAIPSRLAFVLYSDAFFVLYVVANISYWAADREGNVLYPVIGDWANYWHIGMPLTLVGLLFGIPLIHLVHFLKYRLQMAAYECVYKCRYEHST